MQKQHKEWIEDLKFSPDGQWLAVGGHDDKVSIYSMPDCKKHKVFKAGSSYITHIDWSLDSQYIRTNDGSYELLYFDVQNGQRLSRGSTQFRDEPWASNSCVLSFGTQGVW